MRSLYKTNKLSVVDAIAFPKVATPLIISVTYFIISMGFNLWRSVLPGYAVETFSAEASNIGVLFSLAAIPGIFVFLLGYIARELRILLLFGASSFLIGTGLLWSGLSLRWDLLWPGVLAISFGFASFNPVISDFCLQESDKKTAALALGQLKSLGPLAATFAALFILYLTRDWNVRSILIVSGVVVLITGGLTIHAFRNKVYACSQGNLRFRKALIPFYLLNVLAGCRSALFKTLFVVLLINEFHLEGREIAVLILLGTLFSFAGYRLIGKLAKQYNPAKVLAIIYLIAAINFGGLFYFGLGGFLVLYFLDSLLVGSSVVTDSTLKRKSTSKDIIGDLSAGVTLFHLSGALVPGIAVILWDHLGRGAVLSLSLVAVVGAIISRKL